MKIVIVFLFILFSSCTHLSVVSNENYAEIVESGLVECFPADTKNNLELASCEVSAANFHNNTLLVVNDKPVESPRSSFMKLAFNAENSESSNFKLKSYIGGPVLNSVMKIEAMAIDHDRGLIFATTGFDRIKKKKHSWDSFNTLIVFPADDTNNVKVVNEENNEGHISSLSIRDSLLAAVGKPYFKVEGLAVLSGDEILFGVREKGKSYKKFKPVIELYKAKYRIIEGEFFLDEKIEHFFTVDQKTLNLKQKVSLSSVEYNDADNHLYILTSYENEETDEGLGAYLWKVDLDQVSEYETKLVPVKNKSGRQIHFAHKAEGMTILPDNRLFIVHDDDKVVGRENITDKKNQFFRPLNSFAYSVLKFY